MRIEPVTIATVFAVLLLACSSAPQRPNLLLFVTDTLRADALSCYGGPAQTPNICALADRGVLFEATYANGPWTPPSAVSLFTGNYPSAYANLGSGSEGRSFWVSDEELLLAEALREQGYDVVRGSSSPMVRDTNSLQGFDPGLAGAVQPQQFLRAHSGAPFFLLEWVMDPHAPYEARGAVEGLEVDDTRLSKPVSFYASLGHSTEPRMREHAPRMSAYELDVLRRLYHAEVERVDEKVGILVRELEAAGVGKSTYFVFTSDHGEGFGEHGQFLHGISFFDELVRVPLIVAGPGIPGGRRVHTPVSLVDVMPTLRDLLGVECLNDPQGRSLAALLRTPEANEAAERAPHYLVGANRLHGGLDALVQGNYKLISMLTGGDRLYDLSQDPAEQRDLAAERPQVVARMRRELDRIRAEKDERRRRNFASQSEGERAEIHEQALEGLRALGYVE